MISAAVILFPNHYVLVMVKINTCYILSVRNAHYLTAKFICNIFTT